MFDQNGAEESETRWWLVVGVVLIVFALVVSLIVVAPWRVTREVVACEDLRTNEVARSELLLTASLTGSITTAAAELEAVRADLRTNRTALAEAVRTGVVESATLEAVQSELADKEADRSNSQAEEVDLRAKLTTAKDAGADASEIDGLEEQVAEPGATTSELTKEIANLTARITELNETIATTAVAVSAIGIDIDDLVVTQASLTDRFTTKYRARSVLLTSNEQKADRVRAQDEIAEIEAALLKLDANDDAVLIVALKDEQSLFEAQVAILDESLGGNDMFVAGRSSANLIPSVPVVRIDLGGHRFPTRVEVVLESVSVGTSGEAADSSPDASTAASVSTDLPDKAEFFVEAGQLRRSEGIAIPTHEVSAWARRVGSVVMLSVCITPAGLDAGSYTGDVFLVDPSLNPTKVSVEVTAQSVFINWLYLLLIIVPVGALFYVWVTSRYTAGEDPWKGRPFWKWLTRNAVVAFVVGFAAVWATLQVPFNNSTWGTSLIAAVAVVGVGLVAAVTAMTVVTGKVRGKDIDVDDDGAQAGSEEMSSSG